MHLRFSECLLYFFAAGVLVRGAIVPVRFGLSACRCGRATAAPTVVGGQPSASWGVFFAYDAVSVSRFASVGNSLIQSATMHIVPIPPITTDGTAPNQPAVTPDSNSPN